MTDIRILQTLDRELAHYTSAILVARNEAESDLYRSCLSVVQRVLSIVREVDKTEPDEINNTSEVERQAMKEYIDYLRYQSQSRQEWSEEDKETIRDAINRIEQLDHYWNRPRDEKLIKRLKSLRPSWKPSEDEERLINTSISFLKDFADKGYENAVECIDWLKSKLSGNSGK